MRLLLAEDEKELANALAAVLKHNKYSIDVVYNGADTFGTNTRERKSRAASRRTPDVSIFFMRLTLRARLIRFLLIFLSIIIPLLQQKTGFAVHVWYYIEKMLLI